MARLDDAAREYAWTEYVFPAHPLAWLGMAWLHEARARSTPQSPRTKRSPAKRRRLTWLPRSELYASVGRDADARRHYTVAESCWRVDAPNPAALARLLADSSRAGEAVRVTEEAFTCDAVAWSYFKAGRYDDAAWAMREARRTAPGIPSPAPRCHYGRRLEHARPPCRAPLSAPET